MTIAEIRRIKHKISRVLRTHTTIAPATITSLLPIGDLVGKLYEAAVLAEICRNLVTNEHLTINFVNGTRLTLRQKGGPIHSRYPYFQCFRGRGRFGDLHTDIYFKTLSYIAKGALPLPLDNGDFHELDIALVQPGTTDYPLPDEIILAVECKHTVLKKQIIRELLGFRRELSYLQPGQPTNFTTWPAAIINANPNSVHMLYTNDSRRIGRYADNCMIFGTILEYYRM